MTDDTAWLRNTSLLAMDLSLDHLLQHEVKQQNSRKRPSKPMRRRTAARRSVVVTAVHAYAVEIAAPAGSTSV